MGIARPGWNYIGIGAASALCGIGAYAAWGSRGGCVIAVLGAASAVCCAYFFRDPERLAPADETKIYSPGDGRVLSVVREGGTGACVLRIFLSIFDVHVQRFPCSGTVSRVEYKEGSFALAMRPEASRNERNVVSILPHGGAGELVVEQIAGFIARRIQCWTREGGRAVAGERYGLIHFGSQVAVRFPADVRLLVKPGDRVIGGITPIAQWGE